MQDTKKSDCSASSYVKILLQVEVFCFLGPESPDQQSALAIKPSNDFFVLSFILPINAMNWVNLNSGLMTGAVALTSP